VKKPPLLLSVLFILALFASFSTNSQAKDLILTNVPVQIYFSPQRGCTEAIVAELNEAKTEILVRAGLQFHLKTNSRSPG
jgi:hypothetical protein